ncbi:MAG: helix-turn-helix domain-containing protein [Actinomycetota bacterium]
MSLHLGTLASELERLARGFEGLNGDGRWAAAWTLEEGPQLLYSGPKASPLTLEDATRRLSSGQSSFEIRGAPGVRGRVVLLEVGGERAAYGLFLHGAGRPHLATTIEQLISEAEASLGTNVEGMSRTQKQELVRFLDDRGAFLIRKAVEEVADRLGVTRFTIYNYLEREEQS